MQTVARRTAATLNLTLDQKWILMDFILFLLMKIPLTLKCGDQTLFYDFAELFESSNLQGKRS